ncbi:MAG: NAD(P)H-hydrate dehydratase [Acidilobaceae archaeon]
MSISVFKKASEKDAITTEDMVAIEVNSAWWGVHQDLLMENAGKALADFVRVFTGVDRGSKVAVVAGRGGNGGDGLVAARILASRGISVEVHLTHDPSSIIHKATPRMLDYVLRSKVLSLKKPGSRGWLELSGADLIIDAVLGTGVRGEPRGTVKDAIVSINSVKAVKVAVDVPSGLDPDTGDAMLAVKADYTLTFHKPKIGLFLNKGPQYSGEVYVAEIGIPREAEEYAGPGDVLRIPRRPKDAKKGDGGRVLVIGGSERFVGAPVLAAKAAYASGADLVYVHLPKAYAHHVASCHPELIPVPREHGASDLELLKEVIEKSHAIVLGPGLGVSEESRRLVDFVIEQAKGKPLVIDADALKIVAETKLKLWNSVVLTPHRGEARLLSGASEADLVEQAKKIATKYEATVIIKAPEDVICSSEAVCKKNVTGHPAMAVGGTGDVLAGTIGSFLARKASLSPTLNPLNVVAAAAYVVGRAGELAVEEKGENIFPQDVLNNIPKAIEEAKRLLERTEATKP